ncbi:DUF5694 domain-containing protein [Hymenobacter sp. J193]|uniref:DUF5694 domain-containing protein n=1 Tax=Hymenobacter sp. J193 TaxID=2898429 RepID=UPI002150996E|nr:DUF5694 domain-containing protein [Hymenobacter sp. J193]MCR5888873.1 DUF5694 domain-containing protein [Hymenobacter sp. J193]
MQHLIRVGILALLSLSAQGQDLKNAVKSVVADKPKEPIEIVLLGSTHFGGESLYQKFPKADLLSEKRQQEVAEVNKRLARFRPDMVMVEDTPEEQASLDSLYTLYKAGKVKPADLPYSRSEKNQFGFAVARQLGHERVWGIDCYESVSSRMLTSGTNLNYFVSSLDKFSAVGRLADTQFKDGTLGVQGYLEFLNHPAILDVTYRTLFINPARVQQGRFTNPPAQYVDTAYVSPRYIGAEFISVFTERELKIYSNIVATQLAHPGKRLLVVIGQRHAAALTKIFASDPAYKVVPVSTYLKGNVPL